jgi:predicted nucleic acid-binding protein
MLVVADSSPLIVLIEIELIGILPRLFGQVVIPPQVATELLRSTRPQAVQDFMVSRPAWLVEKPPAAIEAIPLLHAGEIAAICLAQELKADLLLIDEINGRKAAAERRIPFTGTIGILEFAADRGLLDLQEAFARIKNTGFWISEKLLNERLKHYRERKQG